ncbi:MAG: GGDEF domain-containing protein [Acholeplasmatales bacterium]|nr:GGDEF domain-containing protein [Acholeplasmatales bacterium]
MKDKEKVKGLRSIYVFIPAIIWISILYVLIIICTVLLNTSTANMASQMENTASINREISRLQSASSKMSETVTSFAYAPTIIKNGEETLNVDPLNAYLSEFGDDSKKPDNIVARLQEYNLNEEIMNSLKLAAENSKKMVQIQVKAIYIINSISYVNIKQYISKLPVYELTDTEKAMNDEAKQGYAYGLLMNREYSVAKSTLSSTVGPVQEMINKQNEAKNNETKNIILIHRGLLWGSISSIIITNILLFFVLLKRLVFPITKYAKQIDNNERLDPEHSLYEANYLAKTYNNLMDRHKIFENKLREVAETDSLTGLPNRHCYNEFLKKPVEEKKSTCVFLLDINNLKLVNDTYGHAEGDELIKNASCCIKDCFLIEEGKNCYRIGGDEFVVILDNTKENEIESLLQKFNEKQHQYNVSIAIGYAYTINVKDIGYEKLIMEADKQMYANKEMYKKSLEKDNMYC